MADTLERVRKIVIEHLDADPEKVTEKASFIDDLGADSLDNVELVMAFEEEFDIEIPDDAAETIQTVGRRGDFHRRQAERLIEGGLPHQRGAVGEVGGGGMDPHVSLRPFGPPPRKRGGTPGRASGASCGS
jgi:acyl carrier protein